MLFDLTVFPMFSPLGSEKLLQLSLCCALDLSNNGLQIPINDSDIIEIDDHRVDHLFGFHGITVH